jgi:hypothetical protein
MPVPVVILNFDIHGPAIFFWGLPADLAAPFFVLKVVSLTRD